MMWKWNNVPIPPQDLVGLALGGILQFLFPYTLIANPRVGDILGWLFIAIGSGIVVWSVKEAGEIDIESPTRLLVSGPYSLSRNPMYFGWTLIYLGIAFVLNSVWITALLPLVIAFTHFVDVPKEERSMKDQFGDEYLEYQRRVRRYL